MAFENPKDFLIGVKAGASMATTGQYLFGVFDASGDIVVNTTAGGAVEGVIQDNPASGENVAVATLGASKIVYGDTVTAGDKLMSNASGQAVKAVSSATAALKAMGTGPYIMAAGDTLVLDVDNVGNATSTWDAASATITDTTTYAVTDQDGLTMTVTLDDVTAQTVTFSGATTTALQVAAQINDQTIGLSAVVSGGQVVLSTDKKGTDATIATGAGTGNLTWAAAVAGTGDVANIRAVTSTEVETVIEADTTALITVAGAGGTIYSPTTGTTSELDFKSGNALAILGFSVEAVIGVAAPTDTQVRGKAYVSGVVNDIGTMTMVPTGTLG